MFVRMLHCVSMYVILCRCVCISLEAADDADVVLALSYVVSSASWSPQYDLRVFSSDKTMKVTVTRITFSPQYYPTCTGVVLWSNKAVDW